MIQIVMKPTPGEGVVNRETCTRRYSTARTSG